MKSISRLVVAAAAATCLVNIPSASASDAVCSLDFAVDVATDGTILPSRPGEARCVGRVGGGNVDPLASLATVSGRVRPGVTGCAPILEAGRLAMALRPLISFEPDRVFAFGADWTSSAPSVPGVASVSGTGFADGPLVFNGVARYTAATDRCSEVFAPGTLRFDLVIEERPDAAPASGFAEPAPVTATPPPEPRMRKPSRRCRCRGSASARRRCSKATRRPASGRSGATKRRCQPGRRTVR